jgi:3-methylfumaryl-CoA hydratase
MAMDTARKIELEGLRSWIGRREETSDVVLPLHVAGLEALLDRSSTPPQDGEIASAGVHWLIRPHWVPQSALGADGHPERRDFAPPVPLPRRMWAGSRLDFTKPFRVGDTVTRQSEIVDVVVKEGRGGALVFVKVRRAYRARDGLAMTEEQDIAYREAPDPSRPPPTPEEAPPDGPWRRIVTPDPVMLFRYSALTYNGHRIHYDHPYVTKVEGYPGLIVHGPLLATLLLDLVRREAPGATLQHFVFRAMAPVFATASFTVTGVPNADGCGAVVWIKRADGALAMRAEATFNTQR